MTLRETELDLGPVRRWKANGILWAENDAIKMAYAVTKDARKYGTFAWYGPKKIGVELISQEQARAWDSADGESAPKED